MRALRPSSLPIPSSSSRVRALTVSGIARWVPRGTEDSDIRGRSLGGDGEGESPTLGSIGCALHLVDASLIASGVVFDAMGESMFVLSIMIVSGVERCARETEARVW